jgi:FAD:protein FMN transferase
MDPGGSLHRFQHQAMATIFEVLIAGEGADFASRASRAVFEEIDRLEQELSRYRPNSDVSRINNLPPGGETRVSADTFECLQLAHQFWRETHGAFDITLGALMGRWVGPDHALLTPDENAVEDAARHCGMDLLTLDEATFLVGVGEYVPLIDPGAIGKGFAVDKCVELLKEWGVSAALVHGGTSTAAGYGRSWPVTLSSFLHPEQIVRQIHLDGNALSGSGIRKGLHIIDARAGRPVTGRNAAWVCTASATASDALSTAFMVMTIDEIAAFCAAHADIRALVLDPSSRGVAEQMITFGWESPHKDGE